MQQGANKLHFLLHALGKLIHALGYPIFQVEALAPLLGTARGFRACQAMQFAKQRELIDYRHLAIKPALLREISNAVKVRATERLAEQADLT